MQCKQIHVHGAKPPKLVDKILSAENENKYSNSEARSRTSHNFDADFESSMTENVIVEIIVLCWRVFTCRQKKELHCCPGRVVSPAVSVFLFSSTLLG